MVTQDRSGIRASLPRRDHADTGGGRGADACSSAEPSSSPSQLSHERVHSVPRRGKTALFHQRVLRGLLDVVFPRETPDRDHPRRGAVRVRAYRDVGFTSPQTKTT